MIERDALPSGWAWATLADLTQPSSAKVEPSTYGDLPYVGLEHIESGTRRLLGHGYAREVKSTKALFRRGDVLYGKLRPYLRKVWHAEFDGVCSTDILVYPPSRAIDGGFLAYVLASQAMTEHAVQASAGINLPRVNVSALGEAVFALPPVSEQRRIVAKLDELFASSRAARAALDPVSTLVERHRQAMLRAAFRGDLTTQWRRDHSDVVGGDDLLELVDADLADVPRGRRAREKTGIQPSELSPLPATWRWTDADRCTRRLTVGHVGPMQTRYAADGVPFLRSQNVRENRIDATGLQFIPQDFHRELAKSALSTGDVVIVRSGAPGVAAVVPAGLPDANCADLVIARFSDLLEPELMARFINSQECRERIFARQVGVAQQHFNVGAMRTLPIPLIPVDEQKELLRILREHDAVLERVRSRASVVLSRLEVLDSAALAKAFRGELVSQDPSPCTP